MAVTASEVIVGKIMIANNRITASSELPPAVLTPASDASPFTSGLTGLGAILTMNSAVSTAMGKASSSAPKAEISVLITMNPTP